jgi:preprotein translocase subunit SecE
MATSASGQKPEKVDSTISTSATRESIDADSTLRPRRGARPSPTRGEHGYFHRITRPRFVIEIIDELRKVTWPSRYETQNLTTVVVIVTIAAAVFLGATDFVFSRLLENVLLP